MDEKKVARLFAIRAQIKELEAEAKDLTDSIKNGLDADTYAVGPFKVDLVPNRRFDPKMAEKMLTEGQLRKVTKRVVDSALLKAHYPDLFPQAQRDYGVRVLVNIPEED